MLAINPSKMLLHKIYNLLSLKPLRGGGVRKIFYPLIFRYYRKDIWRIYNSYKQKPRNWKKEIWYDQMFKNAAGISLEAEIQGIPILPHGLSGIFVSRNAKIGKGCIIFQQVTIGSNTLEGSKSYGAPVIGDNVYIGVGAKIIGGITVGENCRIGANAVVYKDIPPNSLVVCSPTRVIQKETPLKNTFSSYDEKWVKRKS